MTALHNRVYLLITHYILNCFIQLARSSCVKIVVRRPKDVDVFLYNSYIFKVEGFSLFVKKKL